MTKLNVLKKVKGYSWYRPEYKRVGALATTLGILFLIGCACASFAGLAEWALLFWGLIVTSGVLLIAMKLVDNHERELGEKSK